MTDFHDLIHRMAAELDHYRQLLTDDRREVHPLAVEARAVLAQPEPDVVGPTPSDQLVEQWVAEVWHEGTPVRVAESDLHLAARAAEWGIRWSNLKAGLTSSAPAPAEGEVAEVPTDEKVEAWADDQGFIRGHGDHPCGFWIDDGDVGALVRAALARWGNQFPDARKMVSHPAPVPVAERLPGDALCWWYEPDEDDDGSGYGGNWTLLRIRGAVSYYTHWLPATALPLPSGEVE